MRSPRIFPQSFLDEPLGDQGDLSVAVQQQFGKVFTGKGFIYLGYVIGGNFVDFSIAFHAPILPRSSANKDLGPGKLLLGLFQKKKRDDPVSTVPFMEIL